MAEICNRCGDQLEHYSEYKNEIKMKDSVLSLFGDYTIVCDACARSFRRLVSAWLDMKTPEYQVINPDNLAPWVSKIGER